MRLSRNNYHLQSNSCTYLGSHKTATSQQNGADHLENPENLFTDLEGIQDLLNPVSKDTGNRLIRQKGWNPQPRTYHCDAARRIHICLRGFAGRRNNKTKLLTCVCFLFHSPVYLLNHSIRNVLLLLITVLRFLHDHRAALQRQSWQDTRRVRTSQVDVTRVAARN